MNRSATLQLLSEHMPELVHRIEPASSWEDLVLPEHQKTILRQIAAHMRNRLKVSEGGSFSRKNSRRLGLSTLFAGENGIGKIMAAEVLAREVHLDLYRIDLSTIVSKYIGETEKNLRKVFDAAVNSGAILLFDEADALFGKHSEVKNSHDRYANIEVSYLLQRIEAYAGLTILASNLKTALDSAFQRRLNFVVEFPLPEAAQRKGIWRIVLPSAVPGLEKGADTEGARKMVVQPYTGSCHCGAVHFSFEAEAITKGVRCNCSYCAKRGTMIHLVPGEKFKINAMEGALNFYQFGKMQAKHYFCANCGISTFSETTRRLGQYIVNLGCVEGVDTFALETTTFDGKHLL